MKIDIKSIKNVVPNKNLIKKILALIISIAVIIISYIILDSINQEAKDTVSVLRVKSAGLNAYSVITEENIEKYSIIKKEFNEDMIKAEEMSNIINQYAKYYIRKGSVLYKDQISVEKPQKNEWLYELEEDKEILTLPYNYLECGGDILIPGDRIRIRVSYEVTESNATNDENPNIISYSSNNRVMRTEVLFDSIVVKDMLNANSHSIYEVYKEVLRLSEDKRQEVMKSRDFLGNIQPRALILEGTSEQINNYAKYKGLEGKTFLITILSRKNSNVIIDQLPTLEKEVESWIGK